MKRAHQADYAGFDEPLIYGSYRSGLLKKAVLLSLLLSLLAASILYATYQGRLIEYHEINVQQVDQRLSISQHTFESRWKDIFQMRSAILEALTSHNPETRGEHKNLIKELSKQLAHHNFYHSLMVLDASASELLRITHQGGDIEARSLTYISYIAQSKTYHWGDIQSGKYAVYFAQESQEPLLMHVITPIFEQQKLTHVLLLSITAKDLMQSVASATHSMLGQVNMTNEQVQWLYTSANPSSIKPLSGNISYLPWSEQLWGQMHIKAQGRFADGDHGIGSFIRTPLANISPTGLMYHPTWYIVVQATKDELLSQVNLEVSNYASLMILLLLLLFMLAITLAWRWELQLRTAFLLKQEGSRIQHVSETNAMIFYQLEWDKESSSWRPVYYSNSLKKTLGYEAGNYLNDMDRGHKNWWMAHIHPDDVEAVRQKFSRLSQQGAQAYALTYRIKHHSGSYRWIQDHGQTVSREHVLGTMGWWLDIHEQKLKEMADVEEAHQTEAWAQGLLHIKALQNKKSFHDIMQASCQMVSQCLNIERVSIWKLDQDQLCSLNIFAQGQHDTNEICLHSEQYPAYFTALHRGLVIDAHDAVHDERTCEFATSYLTPLNIFSMMDATIRVHGEIWGVVCCESVGRYRDWTSFDIEVARNVADEVAFAILEHDKQQVFSKLQEQYKNMNNIVAQFPYGIVIHNGWDILYSNQVMHHMLQIQDAVGADLLSFIHPDDHEALKIRMDQVLQQQKTLKLSNIGIVLPEGGLLWVEIKGIPFVYKGKPAVLTVVHNIDEQRQNSALLLRQADLHKIAMEEQTFVEYAHAILQRIVCDVVLTGAQQAALYTRNHFTHAWGKVVTTHRESPLLDAYHKSLLQGVCVCGHKLQKVGVHRCHHSKEHAIIVLILGDEHEIYGLCSILLREGPLQSEMLVPVVSNSLRHYQLTSEIKTLIKQSDQISDLTNIGSWSLNEHKTHVFLSRKLQLMLHETTPYIPLVSLIQSIAQGDKKHCCREIKQLLQQNAVIDLEFSIQASKEKRRVHLVGQYKDGIYHGVLHDISDFKAYEQRLHTLKFKDSCTGLGNILYARETLSYALQQAPRMAHPKTGVLLIELANLAEVKAVFGQPCSDEIVKVFSQRLRSTIRESDFLSRYSGDQFLVTCSNIESFEDLYPLSERIVEILEEQIISEQYKITLSAYIGAGLSPDDGNTVDMLLQAAQVSVSLARSNNTPSQLVICQEKDQLLARRNLDVVSAMHEAIKEDAFDLVLQPIVDAATGLPVGAEALIRWHHATLGWIPPNEFIPLAEKHGMTKDIDIFMLKIACREWSRMRKSGHAMEFVSINVTPQQMQSAAFVKIVQKTLIKYQMPSHSLHIELTERSLLKNQEHTLQIMKSLIEMGVLLSLDDFGTGYSSLSYLHHFPFSKLKIDMSFVQRIHVDTYGSQLVETILDIGKSMDMEIVAEGVETEEQLTFLRDKGCEYIQGYYFSKPLSVHDFERWWYKNAA